MIVNYYYDLTCDEDCDLMFLCGDCAALKGDEVQYAQSGYWDSCCIDCGASNSDDEDDWDEDDGWDDLECDDLMEELLTSPNPHVAFIQGFGLPMIDLSTITMLIAAAQSCNEEPGEEIQF